MTNAITQDRQPSATEKLLERVNTLTATTEQIRGELSKMRAEIDQVLGEVRSLPHGNEWARNGS
jgi:prefoldin subunit 5